MHDSGKHNGIHHHCLSPALRNTSTTRKRSLPLVLTFIAVVLTRSWPWAHIQAQPGWDLAVDEVLALLSGEPGQLTLSPAWEAWEPAEVMHTMIPISLLLAAA